MIEVIKMSAQFEIIDIEQGSDEWLALRKTKITATDASVIMGENPYKTKLQLYKEKTSEEKIEQFQTPAMKRGIDLEPIARDLFNAKTGWDMKPAVVVKDWAMASLDGRDEESGAILEIKCPGEIDHAVAVSGKVPDKYYAQVQHQMYVCRVHLMYYFSFDGLDGVIIEVKRDDDYIEKMIAEEYKFYQCIINRTPPEPQEDEHVQRTDSCWIDTAEELNIVNYHMKQLEDKASNLRSKLIFLSDGRNTKGGGITLTQAERKGNIDYSKIPELKGLDLEKYRKSSSTYWRIT